MSFHLIFFYFLVLYFYPLFQSFTIPFDLIFARLDTVFCFSFRIFDKNFARFSTPQSLSIYYNYLQVLLLYVPLVVDFVGRSFAVYRSLQMFLYHKLYLYWLSVRPIQPFVFTLNLSLNKPLPKLFLCIKNRRVKYAESVNGKVCIVR